MSKLTSRNRLGTRLGLTNRILLGAVAGTIAAAMFVLMIARQDDSPEESNEMGTFTKTFNNVIFKKVIATADGNAMTSDGNNFYKVDSNGTVLWSAKVQSPFPVMIQELIETTDHGFVAVAQTTGSQNNSRIYVVKISQDGTFSWSRTLEKIQSEFAYGACASDDNGIYLCGSGCSTYNYVLKLNANGDQDWIKDYHLAGVTVNAQKLLKTNNGLMLAGRYQQGSSHYLYLAKLNDVGQWISGKMFAVSHQPSVKSFIETKGGGYLLAGQFMTGSDGSPFIMKTDANGDPIWFKTLACDNAQSINSIITTHDNSILCLGNVFVNSNENVNILLTKLDTNGNMLWSTSAGSDALNGAGYDDAFSIAAVPTNRYIICGTSNGGMLTLTDEAGNGFCHYSDVTINAESLPIQTQILSLYPIASEIFISNVLTLNSNYTTAASPSVCYGNYNDSDNTSNQEPVTNIENKLEAHIYPNPSTGTYTIEIQSLAEEAELIIYDLTGRLIMEQTLAPEQTKVNLSLKNFPDGTYLVSIKSNDSILYQNQIVLQK